MTKARASNMKELALILLAFGLVGSCIYQDSKNYERCVPACGEYVYSGDIQHGQCVCDTTKVKR